MGCARVLRSQSLWSFHVGPWGRSGGRQRGQGAGLHRHRRNAEPGDRAAAASALQAPAPPVTTRSTSTADAATINAANLAGYRAVVFVNSAGDVLNAAQEADLQSYVQGGGGFVGIGETAKLEEGATASFFDTLIGLTGATRTTAASAVSSQDVEFLDRVHPATRDLPMLAAARNDNYYQWTTTPRARSTPSRASASTRSRRRHVGHQRRGLALHRHDRHAAAAEARAHSPGAATSSRAAPSTPAWARPSTRMTRR